MPRKALHRCLALALLCLLPAGCSVTGRTPSPTPTPSYDVSIPFETLATNDIWMPDELFGAALMLKSMPHLTYDEYHYLYAERREWLALVTTPQEATYLYRYLVLEQQELLASLDYSREVALIMFTGADKFQHIQRIGYRYGGLTVHAISQIVTEDVPAETYPSQIVRIRRADVPGELWAGTPLTLVVARQRMGP